MFSVSGVLRARNDAFVALTAPRNASPPKGFLALAAKRVLNYTVIRFTGEFRAVCARRARGPLVPSTPSFTFPNCVLFCSGNATDTIFSFRRCALVNQDRDLATVYGSIIVFPEPSVKDAIIGVPH